MAKRKRACLGVRPTDTDTRFVVRNVAYLLSMCPSEDLPPHLARIRDTPYDYAAPLLEWKDVHVFLSSQDGVTDELVGMVKKCHEILSDANESLFIPHVYNGNGLDSEGGLGPYHMWLGRRHLTLEDYGMALENDQYSFGEGYPNFSSLELIQKNHTGQFPEEEIGYNCMNLWYLRLLDNPLSPLFLHVKALLRYDEFPDNWWHVNFQDRKSAIKNDKAAALVRRMISATELANGLVTLTELRSGYFFGVKTPPDLLPDDHPVYQGQFDDFVLGHRHLTRRHRQEYMKSWGQYISPRLQKLLGFKAREGKPLRDTRGVKHAQKQLFGKGSIRENIARRELSGSNQHNRLFKASFLPNPIGKVIQSEESRTYCGAYSSDGSRYLTINQDSVATLYHVDTDGVPSYLSATIPLHSNSWTITDCAFANTCNKWAAVAFDGCLYISGDMDEDEEDCDFEEVNTYGHAAAFSVKWSSDDRLMLLGRSARLGYTVIDSETGKYMYRRKSLSDMNEATWATGSDNVFFGAMDSGTLDQFDLRLKDSHIRSFVGHLSGLTSCDVHSDGVHVLTTAKDGRSKLWDVRKASLQRNGEYVSRSEFNQYRIRSDYRETLSYLPPSMEDHPLDESVVTYSGAFVVKSLVRSRFSPCGGYVASGSADGIVRVWKLDGTLATCLNSHQSLKTATDRYLDPALIGARASLSSLIRDVQWHPKSNALAASMFISSPDDGLALRERLDNLHGVSVGGAFTWQTFQPQQCGATVVHSVGTDMGLFRTEKDKMSLKPYIYECPEYFKTEERVRGDSGYSLSERWYEVHGS
ncbi:WD40-repeat-containing domain protein [Yarrowia lipolytica]|jgi:WD repeat-containing protein 23|nr:WD40-repeat-containing domain protein [Yarrowia lipolytica]